MSLLTEKLLCLIEDFNQQTRYISKVFVAEVIVSADDKMDFRYLQSVN